jgi:hypothetical protein
VQDPDGAAAIRRLSAEAARAAKWDWEREAAARTGGLAVWSSIGATLVVTPEGTVLSIHHDDGTIREESNAGWIRMALVLVARKDPALRSWAPVRPEDARVCTACAGVGTITQFGVVLECGTCFLTGWLA